MNFSPNEHIIQLKSKQGSQDYLPVAWRLVWFREANPNGTIETEEVVVDLDREVTVETYVWNQEKRRSEKVQKTAQGYARFKAIVSDGKGGRATATGSECAADFSEYIEKAETKAVGRALAMLGYGTQFAPELSEEHRIVDSPVERHNEDHSIQVKSIHAQQEGTTSPMTFNQVYNKGLQKGKWTKETFPSVASGILNGFPINKDSVNKLTAAQIAQLDAAIAQESAA